VPHAESACFRGLQGCWCGVMTEKRQGISAPGEESGKRGAVFLPLPTLPLSKAGVGSFIVYIPRYSAALMFWARPNGLGFAFGELLGKAPQVTKGACSWLGPSYLGVPSLRRRSVGPRRTDIHVLTALSRHPCRSAHSASSALGLHPSRDGCRQRYLRTKIKINSRTRSRASRLKPVPLTARVAF
jgi:hypothetical protein